MSLLQSFDDLTLRPIAGTDELDLFCRLPYVLNDELAGDLQSGRRRPEWMWMALRGEQLVARVAWWSNTRDAEPGLLDILDLSDDTDLPGRVAIGVHLVQTAATAVLSSPAPWPGYVRFVAADWRANDATRRGVEDRMEVLERTGARLLVERLRFELQVDTMPARRPSPRLIFRQPEDRAELVALMTRVLIGTLDAHSRQALASSTAEEVANHQYDTEFMSYASPHDWWRIGCLSEGEPVGFVIPAHNGYNPIIAYIGVLPGFRGRGYVDDLVAEGGHILARNKASRIRASTDVSNVPMAEAFERAGYVAYQRQIDMTWKPASGQ